MRAYLVVVVLCVPTLANAQELSYHCGFTSGPRAGSVQDYTGHPGGPLPVGYPCQDGMGSSGRIVSEGGARPGYSTSGSNNGGSCRSPSSEVDCDMCKSDRSYERCLEKLDD